MKCRFCQAPIPSASVSCFHCGRQQREDDAGVPRPVAQRPPEKQSPARVLLALGAVAVLAAVAFVALRAGAPSPPPPEATSQTPPETPQPQAPPEPATPVQAPPAPAWSGDTPLHCRGDERIVLRDAAVTLDQALRLDGHCELTLERCSVAIAGDAIRIDGNGRLVMKGGAIKSSGRALRIDGSGEARLEGVAITGTVEGRGEGVARIEGGSITAPADGPAIDTQRQAVVALRGVAVQGERRGAVIELSADDDADARIAEQQALAANMRRYESFACDGVVECYTDNDASGNVDIHVTSRIGDGGKAVSGQLLKADGANPAARACLQKLAAGRHIGDFQGPKGTLSCRIAGTVMGGTRMISVSSDYSPDG